MYVHVIVSENTQKHQLSHCGTRMYNSMSIAQLLYITSTYVYAVCVCVCVRACVRVCVHTHHLVGSWLVNSVIIASQTRSTLLPVNILPVNTLPVAILPVLPPNPLYIVSVTFSSLHIQQQTLATAHEQLDTLSNKVPK